MARVVLMPLRREKGVLGIINRPGRSFVFLSGLNCWFLLGWLGGESAEEPFIILGLFLGLLAGALEGTDDLIRRFTPKELSFVSADMWGGWVATEGWFEGEF
jgi:hypothetical protein